MSIPTHARVARSVQAAIALHVDRTGESMNALARRAGISQPGVLRYASGTTVPDAVRSILLADALGIPLDTLLDGWVKPRS